MGEHNGTTSKKEFGDRFTQEMTEAAEGMRSVGLVDEATNKLMMCNLKCDAPEEKLPPVTVAKIK